MEIYETFDEILHYKSFSLPLFNTTYQTSRQGKIDFKKKSDSVCVGNQLSSLTITTSSQGLQPEVYTVYNSKGL